MKKLFDKYFQLVKECIPEKKAISSVGLDIGQHSCKLVQLIKLGSSFKIFKWAIIPRKGQELELTIKDLFAQYDIQAPSLYTAVSGKGTLVRYLDAPQMSIQDLRKSFEIEADKYFPFPSDQIYTDCYILSPKNETKRMSVLVAAAKKDIVDERVALLSKLNLQTNFVGMDSLAIANLFHVVGEKEAQSAIAILDMGERVSNLILLVDGLPRFTRDIHIGGQEYNKYISSLLGVDGEEAENLKHTMSQQKQEIINACESVLSNLISEIRLSFDYFTTEQNIPVSKLYLTGGATSLDFAKDFFVKNLEMTTEQWSPVEAFQLSEDISAEDLKDNIHRLSVALGLALYQYD